MSDTTSRENLTDKPLFFQTAMQKAEAPAVEQKVVTSIQQKTVYRSPKK